MGAWEQLRSLNEEYIGKLKDIYMERKFPLEIRAMFSEWIEEQPWQSLDANNEESLSKASALLKTLTKMIEMQATKPQDLIMQLRFNETKKQFSDEFLDQPEKFLSTMKAILHEEIQLLNVKAMTAVTLDPPSVDQIQGIQMPQPQPAMSPSHIMEVLQNLEFETGTLDNFLKEYKQHQENFIIQYQDIVKIEGEIKHAESTAPGIQRDNLIKSLNAKKVDTETALRLQAQKMLEEREQIITKLMELQAQGESISNQIIEALLEWRGTQQKSLSGGPKPGSLDHLQLWFERTCDLLWSFYSLGTHNKLLFEALPITKHGQEKEQIDSLLKKVVTNLSTVIMRSFIVDKQPPQVLKTQTKFQASVRLLVGSKLNLQMNSPEVTVSILSEKQCKELVNGTRLEDIETCGEILNDKCVMEHNKDRRMLQAEFKNLQLKKIKRQDRKGQESVLEAKSALVFHSIVNFGGDKLPVVCMSVPVVVVVHGNQGPNSEATIIWDNMFSDAHRQPFDVPEEVPWRHMLHALDARWTMTCDSKLQREHLMYHREKLFSNIGGDVSNLPEEQTVPWTLFNKEPLRNRTFTFWEWFHGAIEVVKKNLKEYWLAGCLEFVSRQTAQEQLLSKPIGTFLIRFSDGVIGAVSIAWCGDAWRNGEHVKEIYYLQPWNAKDFGIRSLADRIFDIHQLTNLYPDIPKEEAFGQLRTNEGGQDTNDSGYVYSGIMARILPNASSLTLDTSAYSPASADVNMMM